MVEISDSSVKKDCENQEKLYAKAGILDNWVVGIPGRQFDVFREPTKADDGQQHLFLSDGQQIAPLRFLGSKVESSKVLPE